ncbi:unnamed protein product [Prunus armeniaca]|uniref:Uncharacterized protein n=1 Tax=Prunus armeniaca TaxID=36596 RepID=A0A6J5UFZ7_PRUAR|nr:unnamed protein product [Prunus armeniaca]
MADSTQANYEKNKEVAESDSIESSYEVPFELLEKVMREGFHAMTNSMNHLSQSVVQTVEKGHLNGTQQGNEMRAYSGYLFERVIQAEQEDRMVRKEDEMPPNAKTPLEIQGYSTGQTSGHAHSSSPEMVIRDSLRSSLQVDQPMGFDITSVAPHMPKVISPPKDTASQHLAPFETLSKYQASKTGEAALPLEPVRRNMHADRW